MIEQASNSLIHLKTILEKILRTSHERSQSETIILTSRARQCIFSIMNELEIFKCGFRKLLTISEFNSNPYLKYKNIVLALTATPECMKELTLSSSRLSDIYIVNLTVSTSQNKKLMKESSLRDCCIKGLIEENLDFIYYLDNVYKLNGNSFQKLDESQIVERLVSSLCCEKSFWQFEIHYPKKNFQLGNLLKEKLQQKLAILQKYEYKGLKSNSAKTKLVILERIQNLSPFIYSLYYGSLIQELELSNSCALLSSHSSIYKRLYCMDLLEASTKIQQLSLELSKARKMKIQTDNFEETKKILIKNYNPEMTKEQINFHYEAMGTLNTFAAKKQKLICLQQNIANGITEEGEKIGGSDIVKNICKWSEQENAQYEEYLGLVLMSLQAHSFWWFQKGEIQAALKEKHKQAIKKYAKKVKGKQSHLKEKPPNQQGQRFDLFRHQPFLVHQFFQWEKNPSSHHEKIQINKTQKPKYSNIVIYIHSPMGYNELVMLMRALKGKQIKIICSNLLTVKEWGQLMI